MVKRSRQKFTILGRKRGFKMKQQALCMILKGLLLKQIKQYFSEGDSSTLYTMYHCTTKDCRTFFY